MSQETILVYLRSRAPDWVRVSELRDHLQIAEPNIYRAVHALVKGKFAEKRQSPDGAQPRHASIIEVRIKEDK